MKSVHLRSFLSTYADQTNQFSLIKQLLYGKGGVFRPRQIRGVDLWDYAGFQANELDSTVVGTMPASYTDS